LNVHDGGPLRFIVGFIDIEKNIVQIYGISQNPNTKDYIIVLQYVKGGSFDY
jgi:hypothetical protein